MKGNTAAVEAGHTRHWASPLTVATEPEGQAAQEGAPLSCIEKLRNRPTPQGRQPSLDREKPTGHWKVELAEMIKSYLVHPVVINPLSLTKRA